MLIMIPWVIFFNLFIGSLVSITLSGFLKSVMDEKKENMSTIYEKEISQKLLDQIGIEIKSKNLKIN